LKLFLAVIVNIFGKVRSCEGSGFCGLVLFVKLVANKFGKGSVVRLKLWSKQNKVVVIREIFKHLDKIQFER
jgi:hypothetical protein